MNPTITYIKAALAGYYPDAEATALAKWILRELFSFSTLELYGGKDRSFSAKEQAELDNILHRLRDYEPMQYIIGSEQFCGLSLAVCPAVLIPRPETQELVEWIVTEHGTRSRLRILDIGTGSGCIAIALAKQLPEAIVTAWDVSSQALETAAQNCRTNKVNIRLVQQDVLKATETGEQYDLIISNPPYITECERTGMAPNVLNWEPSTALFVPDDDPLLFYRCIARLGKKRLLPGGFLYFEINQAYGEQVLSMLATEGYRHTELRKDLSGNDRMVRAILR